MQALRQPRSARTRRGQRLNRAGARADPAWGRRQLPPTGPGSSRRLSPHNAAQPGYSVSRRRPHDAGGPR